MVRSLYTAASGMISQQTNVDTISNNLANINTVGYKRETAEFKTLLYQSLAETATDADGNAKPVGVQVGSGVRNSAIVSQFTQGTVTPTENPYDLCIIGNGFFSVRMPDGTTSYTRNGSLNMALGTDGLTLATTDGYPILDTQGNAVTLPEGYSADKIGVGEDGNLTYPDENNNAQNIGIQIALVQFSNPSGLEKTSSSLYRATAASGEPKSETEDTTLKSSSIRQYALEASNVQAVDEVVNLIIAQRAYEMNSKAITASDEMLQQANNLRS